MKDRLTEFLRREGLTAVKFAEIMEVQPSSISHLLSGRNKPNFDFISRILLRFPRLNPDWFINGIGEVYKSNTTNNRQEITEVKQQNVTKVIQSNIFDQSALTEEKQLNLQADIISDHTEIVDSEPIKRRVTDVNIEKSNPGSMEGDETAERTVKSGEKSIERIVLFYSDGSFDEYHN